MSIFSIISTIVLCLNSCLYAEYIIFEQGPSSIQIVSDKKTYKYIYENILLKYQWPMSITYYQRLREKMASEGSKPGQIAKEIVSYSLMNVGPLEEKHLRKKIRKEYDKIDIAFIPTFLYELFCLLNKFKITPFSAATAITLDVRSLLKMPGTTENEIYNLYNNLNKKSGARDAHQFVNNELVKYIQNLPFYTSETDTTKKLNPGPLIEKNRSQMADTLITEAKKVTSIQHFDKKEVYDRVLDLEYDAHKKNAGLMYRGGSDLVGLFIPTKGVNTPIEFTYFVKDINKYKPLTSDQKKEFDKTIAEIKKLQEKQQKGTFKPEDQKKLKDFQEKLKKIRKKISIFGWKNPLRSISYGNTLFAGLYNDPGACSYYFMAAMGAKDIIGYGLYINKWLYATGRLKELFTIAPLTTIIGIYSSGEFFHSRSKSYYFKEALTDPAVPRVDVIGILGGAITDYLGFFVRLGNPIAIGAKLSRYIEENATIIKVLNTQGGFSFKKDSKVVKNYFEAQKNVTRTFEIMSTVYNRALKLRRKRSLSRLQANLSGLSKKYKKITI